MSGTGDDNVPTFIKRKRGTVLLFKGRQFYKQRVYKNLNEIWQCSMMKKKSETKYLGTVTIANRDVIKEVEHTCQENHLKNDVDMTVNSAKAEAKTSDLPIPQIYKKHLGPLLDRGVNMIVKVPSLSSVKTSLYGSRYDALGIQKIKFDQLKQVEIPLKFQNFCIGDYSNMDSRILVFCTEKAREMMLMVDEYFIDGTFKSCPKPFAQLIIIHGDLGGTTTETNTTPLVFALLPDKKQESYVVLFEIIKSQISEWKPIKIHMDYEKATIKAAKSEFPLAIIKGCFYHYTKCLYKKSKNLNLNNKVERRFVGLCSALALLPENLIDDGWLYIQSMSESFAENAKIVNFLKYVRRTWLRGDFRSQWCIHHERHRTNNFAESWNTSLNKALSRNVTILSLLNFLSKATAEKGNIPKKRRRDQIERNTLICETQLSLLHGNISVGHFLEIHR